MLNKERILLMIRLATRESEYGSLVTQNGPLRKEYVGAYMFMYFFVESLLYLMGAGGYFAYKFLQNNLSFPMEKMAALLISCVIIYICITVIGLVIVRRTALKEYKEIKRSRKAYLRDLEELIELSKNE